MNRVSLTGRICNDLKLEKIPTGTSKVEFRVAANRIKKGEADFIPCVAWGKSAEYLYNYYKKGNLVSVSGEIRTSSYVKNDGSTVYTWNVTADRVEGFETKSRDEYNANGLVIDDSDLPY